LISDPLARALTGFPEIFLVRFDHPTEAGSATGAEGMNDLLAPAPDGHLIEAERLAQTSTRARMVRKHIEDDLMETRWRMDSRHHRAGRRRKGPRARCTPHPLDPGPRRAPSRRIALITMRTGDSALPAPLDCADRL